MAHGTMRKAYHTWQALNRRLQAARNDLNHQYLALLNKVEDCRIAPQRGILRTAASILQQAPDPQTLQLQDRLHNAFALLGKSFFRRAPTSLQLDLFRFTDQIQEVCRQCHYLGNKLRIAQKVFDIVRHNHNISKQCLYRALINPEVVWVTLLLQQRCLLTSQAVDLSLTHSWQTKQALCQRFFKLLQPLLPPNILRDLQKSLNESGDPTNGQLQSGAWSTGAQRQLDHYSELAQQLFAEIIASQSSPKNL